MTDIGDEGLSGFVPERFRLAQGTPEPWRASGTGSALFCDVAGFNETSERLLAAHGRRVGAERLHELLGEQLGGVIRMGAQHRGTVIAHAGDALTLWFDAEDYGGDASAARQASACALALAKPFSYMGTRLRLTIASGLLKQNLVGDPIHGRLEIAGGPVMTRLAELDHLPRRADLPILVCARTQTLLQPSGAKVIELPQAHAGILNAVSADPVSPRPLRPVDTETALAWIPSSARAMLRRAATLGTLGEMAEIRTLTALFLQIMDPAKAENAMQAAARAVRETQWAVQTRGGTVLNVNTDAKGTYISCIFGAPVAHEDDTLRAFEAAADLLEQGRRASVEMRIGLARGATLVGVVGDARCWRYDAIGNTMNRAALMMTQAAPGTLRAAEEIAALVPEGIQAQTDHRKPQPGTTRHGTMPPLCGTQSALFERTGELDALCDVISQDAPLPRLAIIEADPGHGKTALLEGVRHRAEADGRVWLAAGGQESERKNESPWFHRRPIASFHATIS
ncbi:adenylate/guanylate cyclase domain-containing protein, partial [Roseinatronobacter sp.]|uniref:adenylate/guanylate cyclase domain-containing protein n=1 Tax=Roseinatronobacter sp. TaxID=1945755 RepID=UPI0025ED5A97